jgi:hypothetical protein
MTANPTPKSLGEAIDGVIQSLTGLDQKAQQTAIKAACEHLGLPATSAAMNATFEGLDPHAPGQAPSPVPPADIRTLKETKQPTTANEMACLVAYYLEGLAPGAERKDRVTVADVDKYFRQAGFPLPKAQKQILFNAKAAGYFDAAGGGEFKLNPVGYNLVVHSLPRTSELRKNAIQKRGRAKNNKTAKSASRGKKK